MAQSNGTLDSGTEANGKSTILQPVEQNSVNNKANGSVITMTMKNNHLIVETEERSVSFVYR